MLLLTDSGGLEGECSDRDEVSALLVPQPAYLGPGKVKGTQACQGTSQAVACSTACRLLEVTCEPVWWCSTSLLRAFSGHASTPRDR